MFFFILLKNCAKLSQNRRAEVSKKLPHLFTAILLISLHFNSLNHLKALNFLSTFVLPQTFLINSPIFPAIPKNTQAKKPSHVRRKALIQCKTTDEKNLKDTLITRIRCFSGLRFFVISKLDLVFFFLFFLCLAVVSVCFTEKGEDDKKMMQMSSWECFFEQKKIVAT